MRSIKAKYDICGVIMRWAFGKDKLILFFFGLELLLLDLNFLYEFRRLCFLFAKKTIAIRFLSSSMTSRTQLVYASYS